MNRYAQKRLGSESNYLTTNDGLGVTDLPRQMPVPRSAEPSGRTTPIIIEPLKYIVYNNPQVAYDFLINKGYNVEPNVPSTYQFARIFVKERGNEGILELVRVAHPDIAMILKAIGQKEDSGFNETPTPPPASQAPSTPAQPTTPVEEPAEKGLVKINTQTIIIALVIVVFFLLLFRPAKAAA
jgi:hypothetical protein